MSAVEMMLCDIINIWLTDDKHWQWHCRAVSISAQVNQVLLIYRLQSHTPYMIILDYGGL